MRHISRDSAGRSVVASTLLILTCLVLGLLSGGMLVIGVSLVSFWKSLAPSDFQAWFAAHAHLVGRLMIPLGVGAIAVTVAAGAACWRGSATARCWLLIAAVSSSKIVRACLTSNGTSAPSCYPYFNLSLSILEEMHGKVSREK